MRGRDAFQDRRNHQAVPWLAHRRRQNRRGVRADAGPITVPPVRRTHLLQTTSERPSPSPRVRQPISQIAEDGNERRGGRAVRSFPTRHLARRYPTPGRWTSTITFRPLRPSTTIVRAAARAVDDLPGSEGRPHPGRAPAPAPKLSLRTNQLDVPVLGALVTASGRRSGRADRRDEAIVSSGVTSRMATPAFAVPPTAADRRDLRKASAPRTESGAPARLTGSRAALTHWGLVLSPYGFPTNDARARPPRDASSCPEHRRSGTMAVWPNPSHTYSWSRIARRRRRCCSPRYAVEPEPANAGSPSWSLGLTGIRTLRKLSSSLSSRYRFWRTRPASASIR